MHKASILERIGIDLFVTSTLIYKYTDYLLLVPWDVQPMIKKSTRHKDALSKAKKCNESHEKTQQQGVLCHFM